MDKKILTSFILIIVVGLIALLLSSCLTNCDPVEISYYPLSATVNTPIVFKINSNKSTLWKFSDGGQTTGDSVSHIFDKDGVFQVEAEVDGDCKSVLSINIGEAKPIEAVPAEITVTPKVNFTKNIYVNRLVTFVDVTPGIEKWNWRIDELSQVYSEKKIKIRFPEAGSYSVRLSVKGKNIKGDTTIPVTVHPYIEDNSDSKTDPATFKNDFIRIANSLAEGDGTVDDEWRDLIVKKSCVNGSFKVYIENEEKEITLESFKISQITLTKKVLSVDQVIGSGCISKIIITRSN